MAKKKDKEAVSKPIRKSKKTAVKGGIYQLRIALTGSKPEIWRQILVSENTTLASLHTIIQELFGWEDDHLHEFVIAGEHYTRPMPGEWEQSKDEKRFYLHEVIAAEGLKFLYTYDFGDNWEHEIVVEKIMDNDERFSGKPVCLGGENAGPPEDCGGIYGYYGVLKAIKNKRHPEHEEIKEWLGEFDPQTFNIERVNRILSRMR
ncbi:MAG: hypothetical protein C0407_11100 [Desulfobacca sp.]|nr:hypothetical protein [Desulfobacca sp.]